MKKLQKLEKFNDYKLNDLAMCSGGGTVTRYGGGNADVFNTGGCTNQSMYIGGTSTSVDTWGDLVR